MAQGEQRYHDIFGFSVVGAEALLAELSEDAGVSLYYCCYPQPPSIAAHLSLYQGSSLHALYWPYQIALLSLYRITLCYHHTHLITAPFLHSL